MGVETGQNMTSHVSTSPNMPYQGKVYSFPCGMVNPFLCFKLSNKIKLMRIKSGVHNVALRPPLWNQRLRMVAGAHVS
jgi:hypothetical protein